MKPLSLPRTRRAKVLLAVLAIVILVAVNLGSIVRRELLAWLVVRAEIPGTDAVEELVAEYADPVPFLIRLWSTGKVAHRQLAMETFRTTEKGRFAVDRRLEAILLAAATDADASVRELALGFLAEQKHPGLLAVARAQLESPDPQLRLLGVQYLAVGPASEAVPSLIPLLDDPDLRMVTSADAALRKLTGIDYGVRIAQSYARPSRDGDASLDPGAVATIKSGVDKRKAWWAAHEKEYSSATPSKTDPPLSSGTSAAPAEDFMLPDLTGRSVSLSSFRGKTVLLNFWATWCGACLVEMPDLLELQKRHGNKLVVLGISLDGVPDNHVHGAVQEESTAGIGQEEEHAHAERARDAIRAKVARLVQARGITYPVLLDSENSVGARFNGGELPTNVLIDASGHVRRRFIGARPLSVWERMLAEIER